MSLQAKVLKEKAHRIHKAADLMTYIASQIDAGERINWNSTLQLLISWRIIA